MLKRYPNKLYIFGENNACYKTGEEWRNNGGPTEDDKLNPCYQKNTQAIIRGEPNAAPIITTIRKNKKQLSLTDPAVKKILKKAITKNISNIFNSLKAKKFTEVVFSEDLVGTGVSKLINDSLMWNFLLSQISRLKPNNTKKTDVSNMKLNNFKAWLMNKPIRKLTTKQTRNYKCFYKRW